MENKEVVNSFLGRSDLSDVESLIKNKALLLDVKLAEAKDELSRAEIDLNSKRNRVIQLTNRLEGTISLILDVVACNSNKEKLEEIK